MKILDMKRISNRYNSSIKLYIVGDSLEVKSSIFLAVCNIFEISDRRVGTLCRKWLINKQCWLKLPQITLIKTKSKTIIHNFATTS